MHRLTLAVHEFKVAVNPVFFFCLFVCFLMPIMFIWTIKQKYIEI